MVVAVERSQTLGGYVFKKGTVERAKDLRVAGLQATLPKSPSRDALTDLTRGMRGQVVLPSDNAYNNSRQLANNAFQTFPQVIAYCEVIGDVRLCLEYAQKQDMWVTTRSGGHCTAGFSANTGIIIDTSNMCYAVVDPRAKRAVVGAGTNFGHLNATLDEWGLHTPGGGCEDVCVAGHMQGGGYGFTTREYGLNCDNVVEAMMMTVKGDIVVANASQNSDLYSAIRGGTGNNFGVLLQITYGLHELHEVWGYGIKWPIANAAAALELMQKHYTIKGAPKQLGYMGIVAYQNDGYYLLMRGMFHGTREAGLEVLAPLLRTKGAELQIDKWGTYYRLNEYLLEQPDPIPAVPDLAREDKQSAILEKLLTKKQWQEILDAYVKTPNPWTTLVLEPYGGYVGEVPVDATAWVHRKASMDLFCDVFWMNEEQNVAAVKFLDEFMAVVGPYSNGHQYQNYPRLGTADYAFKYWGDAYPQLRRVKAKYDPTKVFHYAQMIEPAPLRVAAVRGGAKPKGKVKADADAIVIEPKGH